MKRFIPISFALYLLAGCNAPETRDIKEQVAQAFEAQAQAYEVQAEAYEMEVEREKQAELSCRADRANEVPLDDPYAEALKCFRSYSYEEGEASSARQRALNDQERASQARQSDLYAREELSGAREEGGYIEEAQYEAWAARETVVGIRTSPSNEDRETEAEKWEEVARAWERTVRMWERIR